jgi:DNA-binding CsgD family transcriptional regulator
MILHQEHISYLAEDRIKKIAAPLSKIGDIHYFCYGVNYPDTTGFTLHTNSSYYETWFERQFPMCGFHLASGWYLWDSTLPAEQLEVAKEFDIGQGVNYVNHQKDKTEIFSFGSKPNNSKVLGFYLNNLNLLKRFSHYFLENSSDLLEVADQQRIKPLPNMIKKANQENTFNQLKDNPVIDNFLHELSYPFNLLSERECECFSLILKSYSIAQMSEELSLAIPTVAVYISRIKQKLKCTNRSELIQIARKAGLVEYFV